MATPEELRRLSDEAVAEGVDLSNGLDAPPPLPPEPGYEGAPREEQPPPTADELEAHRVASLDTLDRTIERLEADLEDVMEDGDEEQAHRLELRLQRLRERREERAEGMDSP